MTDDGEEAPPVRVPFDGPVARLVTPLPLDVAAGLWQAIGVELHRRGFAAYFRQEDGLGVIHARRVRDVDLEELEDVEDVDPPNIGQTAGEDGAPPP